MSERAKYWNLPDDGAPFKCASCGKRSHASEMLFLELPNGKKEVVHRECIDEDWFQFADYMGTKE